MTDFEVFALDHGRHKHCSGCGACMLDPSHLVQAYQVWCVGCRDRIKANCARSGAQVPWYGGVEFAPSAPAPDAPAGA